MVRNKEKTTRWAVFNKIFMDNFLAASFIELSLVAAGLVDGIVTSRMLPGNAMAAFGIAQPIFSIIAIFFGLFATGIPNIINEIQKVTTSFLPERLRCFASQPLR